MSDDGELAAVGRALDLAYRRFEADLAAIEWDFPQWERSVDGEGRITFRRTVTTPVTP